MRRPIVISLLLASSLVLFAGSSLAQQEAAESKRKVVNRVMPSYPQIAHNLRIKGVVRIEAVVGPSGSVKMTHVLGGHPLLAQSADDAVHKWRWESASAESKEVVEVRFDPDNR